MSWLDLPHDGQTKDDPEVRSVMDALSAEFVQEGLQPDDEPNRYGLKVDELLGDIAMYIIGQEKT